MKKLIYVFAIAVLLSSCAKEHKLVKRIVDLSKKIEVENPQQIKIDSKLINEQITTPLSKNIKSFSKKGLNSKPFFYPGSNIGYFVDKGGDIICYDFENNKEIWKNDYSSTAGKRKSRGGRTGGGMAYSAGYLYVTNGSRSLLVLDADSGNELGRIELDDIARAAPSLDEAGRMLFVQTISNHLLAYDVSQSKFPKLKWKDEGLFEVLSSSRYISPLIIGDKLLVSYNTGQVILMDSDTGKKFWGVNLADSLRDIMTPGLESTSLTTDPVAKDGFVYLASNNSKLMKIDIMNGKIVWQKSFDDIQSLSIAGDYLFFATNGQQAASVRTSDGSVIWTGTMEDDTQKKSVISRVFLQPFITQTNGGWKLSVISSSGHMYVFESESGNITSNPKVVGITKGIEHLRKIPAGWLMLGEKQAQIIN